MSTSGRALRRGAAYVLFALLAGPVGLGGAWHVGGTEAVHASLPGFPDAPSVIDPSTAAATHGGPTCVFCQLLQGLRGVVPLAVVATASAPTVAHLDAAAPGRPCAGQVPPRAGRSPPAV